MAFLAQAKTKFDEFTEKEDHPLSFPEDNSDNLTRMFDYFDNIIDNYPDEIVRLDPEIVALSQKLVEGV
jgi:hypothetical protein